MYDEKYITLKVGKAKLASDKNIANPWGILSYQAEFEIAKEIKRLNDYIAQLEAQISRDRESLVNHNKHQVLSALVDKAKIDNQR